MADVLIYIYKYIVISTTCASASAQTVLIAHKTTVIVSIILSLLLFKIQRQGLQAESDGFKNLVGHRYG